MVLIFPHSCTTISPVNSLWIPPFIFLYWVRTFIVSQLFHFSNSTSNYSFKSHGLHFLKDSYCQSSFHFAFSVNAVWLVSMFPLGVLYSYIFSGCIFIYQSRKMLAQLHLFTFTFWQLGLIIRAVTSGHLPPYTFILVTMGTTAVLLIGWRALLFSFLPNDESKKNDVYRRGNPFELFEVWAFSCLTHTVRFE